MTRKSKVADALHNSTCGEAAIREFINSDPTSEQFMHRAADCLNSKELLRNVLALTPGDQGKFVDKVDQVWLVFCP